MPSKNAAEMVAGVEGIVKSLAAKYSRISNGRVDAVELAQLGRFAAFSVVESFDPAAGAAFSTYAFAAVRNAMGNEIRKATRASVSLDAPVYGDSDECYIDGLPADGVAPDAALEAVEREEQVRAIVASVMAEHFAAKPELFMAIVERLMNQVDVSARYEGVTQRSDVTLESIAVRFNISREWVRRTEALVKSHLATALSEVA